MVILLIFIGVMARFGLVWTMVCIIAASIFGVSFAISEMFLSRAHMQVSVQFAECMDWGLMVIMDDYLQLAKLWNSGVKI